MEVIMKKKDMGFALKDLLFFVLLFASLIFLYWKNLSHPGWEYLNDWRQTDTYAMAQNFYLDNMNILKPQLNYDGLKDIYVQLELQIIPYISAILFKYFGESFFIIRSVSVAFYFVSIFYFFLLARSFFKRWPCYIITIIYSYCPISLVYGRAIMPEAALMAFFIAGLYYLRFWQMKDKLIHFYISAFCISLAIMEKTPAAFLGILVLFLIFKRFGFKAFKNPHVYIFGLISLGLPFAYFYMLSINATASFVNDIGLKHILNPSNIKKIIPVSRDLISKNFCEIFGLSLLVFAGLGTLKAIIKKNSFLLVLLLAFILEFIIIIVPIKFTYYMIFLSPIFCLLAGEILDGIFSFNAYMGTVFAGVLLLFNIYAGVIYYIPNTKIVPETNLAIEGLKKVIKPQDKIAISSLNPVYINGIGCKGYRAGINYYDFIPKSIPEELDFFENLGIDYFVAMKYANTNYTEEWFYYLKDRYKLIDESPYFFIYKMR